MMESYRTWDFKQMFDALPEAIQRRARQKFEIFLFYSLVFLLIKLFFLKEKFGYKTHTIQAFVAIV